MRRLALPGVLVNLAAPLKVFGRATIAAGVACLLNGCVFFEKPAAATPTMTIAAPAPSAIKRMVIVLPGRGDNLMDLQRSGIAAVIQQQLPDADVMLVAMSLPYYMEGRSVQRLHEEIVVPAKQRGYADIYLAGASMGGMGVLLYEREHPNEMNGLILMAPYMGDASLIKEIKAAGGLAQWNAGPVPAELDRDKVPREEWRVAQSIANNRNRANNVWLVCGQNDRFNGAAQLIAQGLPPGHFIEPAGGHAWVVWLEGAAPAFAQISRASNAHAP
jgi:enterochelin esterase-like enzyme